jgi:hypothetical protein
MDCTAIATGLPHIKEAKLDFSIYHVFQYKKINKKYTLYQLIFNTVHTVGLFSY